MNLDKIRIVLVETSHPGNIGSAARAMKIMGLSRLILVNPNKFPDPKANELASRAGDILAKAQVVKTLDEALESCSLVVGMSARDRVMSQTIMNPREVASKVIKEYASHSSIAFVFGRENSGLNNRELERCPFQVKIPAAGQYSSLNLAAAVQVMAYEILMTSLEEKKDLREKERDYASFEALEGLYAHFEKTAIEVGFLKPQNPRRMMPRIRQILNRSRLDQEDIDLLRGFLSAIENT